MLISLRRREAELFQTEAIVASVVGSATENYEAIEKSLLAYKNAMFPFLESEKGKRSEMAKEALKQWTDNVAFSVRPLWDAQGQAAKKIHSQLRRSAAQTKRAEDLRRKKKHVRI